MALDSSPPPSFGMVATPKRQGRHHAMGWRHRSMDAMPAAPHQHMDSARAKLAAIELVRQWRFAPIPHHHVQFSPRHRQWTGYLSDATWARVGYHPAVTPYLWQWRLLADQGTLHYLTVDQHAVLTPYDTFWDSRQSQWQCIYHGTLCSVEDSWIERMTALGIFFADHPQWAARYTYHNRDIFSRFFPGVHSI